MRPAVYLRVFGAVAISLGVAAAAACGTDAVGVETCRKIETIRCRRAPGCPNLSLAMPVHTGDDIDACIRFYNDACQHGLANGTDHSGPDLNACVNVITNGACSVVEHPESDPACAWLIPPATPDAAVEADAPVEAEAGSD
jgi:hypothetical protein